MTVLNLTKLGLLEAGSTVENIAKVSLSSRKYQYRIIS